MTKLITQTAIHTIGLDIAKNSFSFGYGDGGLR